MIPRMWLANTCDQDMRPFNTKLYYPKRYQCTETVNWCCSCVQLNDFSLIKSQYVRCSLASHIGETGGGLCVRMRVSEMYEDYHINLDKSSSHQPSNWRKQIKALIFVDLLHAMSSNSNRSALSACAKMKHLTAEPSNCDVFIYTFASKT